MNLAPKIYYKLKHEVGIRLLRISLYFDSPYLTSLVLAILTSNINGTENSHTVLCIGRSIFQEDVSAMAKQSRRINYKIIHLVYIEVIFNHFFKNLRVEVTEDNYHDPEFLSKNKDGYREYLAKTISFLRKILGIDGVLLANFVYVILQELSNACKIIGLPLIILHKEGLALLSIKPERLNIHYKNYRFVGDKILLYNETIKEILLSNKIPGLSDNKCEVVGIPRLDIYFEVNKNTSQRPKQVIFFAFSPRSTFQFLASTEEEFNKIEKRTFDFYSSVIKFAVKHPHILVAIKTKMSKHFKDYVTNILMDHFPGVLIPNLTVTNIGDVTQMIVESSVVIGFNSTTLIEGLILNKRIISPYFGDILGERALTFFREYPLLVNYCRNYSELENHILGRDAVKYSPEYLDGFIEKFISKHRGNASITAETAILNTINSINP